MSNFVKIDLVATLELTADRITVREMFANVARRAGRRKGEVSLAGAIDRKCTASNRRNS